MFRSQGTTLTVQKFRRLTVQKLDLQYRGRHRGKFNQRGVNSLTVYTLVW